MKATPGYACLRVVGCLLKSSDFVRQDVSAALQAFDIHRSELATFDKLGSASLSFGRLAGPDHQLCRSRRRGQTDRPIARQEAVELALLRGLGLLQDILRHQALDQRRSSVDCRPVVRYRRGRLRTGPRARRAPRSLAPTTSRSSGRARRTRRSTTALRLRSAAGCCEPRRRGRAGCRRRTPRRGGSMTRGDAAAPGSG